MRPYATDSPERRKVIECLVVLSLPIAYLLHSGISLLKVQLWWLEAPSVLGIFGLLYECFERWVWRWALLRRVGIVKVPDLNGEWRVEGSTSFNSGQRCEGTATIKQTWSKISVCLETAESTSHSISASILLEQPGRITPSYEYRNEPKPGAAETMHSHRGTAVLRLRGDGRELEGEYYSGRDRLNYGGLLFRRKEPGRI